MAVVKEIKFAKPCELRSLEDLQRRSSWVWEEDRAALSARPDALEVALEAITEGRVRVAVGKNEELLGFTVVAGRARDICELDGLFVDSIALRQGMGRALLEDAAARALVAGNVRMTVIAHPRNVAFYESAGFEASEPTRTRFGPALRMCRELARGQPTPSAD